MKKKTTLKLGKVEKTNRGFEVINFKDRSDQPCELAQSSIVDYMQPGIIAVWIGTTDAQPSVLAREAASVGIKTDKTCGWVPYPIPPAVQLFTRAHLDRNQVKALIGHLERWLKTGSLK